MEIFLKNFLKIKNIFSRYHEIIKFYQMVILK